MLIRLRANRPDFGARSRHRLGHRRQGRELPEARERQEQVLREPVRLESRLRARQQVGLDCSALSSGPLLGRSARARSLEPVASSPPRGKWWALRRHRLRLMLLLFPTLRILLVLHPLRRLSRRIPHPARLRPARPYFHCPLRTLRSNRRLRLPLSPLRLQLLRRRLVRSPRFRARDSALRRS